MRARPQRFRTACVSALGSGLLPGPTGTWGSLVAVVLFAGLWRLTVATSRVLHELLLLAALAAACVAAVRLGPWAIARYRRPDPKQFTLDEVSGQWLALLALPVGADAGLTSLLTVLAGQFVLFRMFDVLKPAPARALERLPGGWGILADDLAAGLYANLTGQILWRLPPVAGWLAGTAAGGAAGAATYQPVIAALVLGVIEGLTEFLPISSTGHMVIAMPLLGVQADVAPWNVVLWVSQFAAILAVVLYFGRDLWRLARSFRPTEWPQHVFTRVAVAMVPTIGLALPFKGLLDPLEKSPAAVAWALILGAVAMEIIDRRFRRERPQKLTEVTLGQAFWIGVIQCISMWPGVSRAGASILGGMALGLTPRVATEFSFYLAIPTMLGAALHKLVKHRHELTGEATGLLLVASAAAFVVALVVVAGFLSYVRRYRFTPFAIYRVLLGIAVLAFYAWWT